MVSSPCISVCDMDDANGYCRGCMRTLEEIATWPKMNDEQQQKVIHMLTTRRTGHEGFTLLESMIVLTILALAVGMITVGANVVESGRLRRQVNQLELIESGIQNFRIKYNCYPGDCNDPSVISGYTYSGNGNGFLEPIWSSDENKGFWVHLYASKMIIDKLSAHPVLAGMQVPYSTINPKAVLNAYGDLNYSQNVIEFGTGTVDGAMTMERIKYIDSKVDNGLPDSGSIRASGYGTAATTIYVAAPTFPLSTANKNGAAPSTQCVVGGIYNIDAALDNCNMVYVSETR